MHSRGRAGKPLVDERGRMGGRTKRKAEKKKERKSAFHVGGGNSKAWDSTCIGASLLAKKGSKKGEEDPATVLPG